MDIHMHMEIYAAIKSEDKSVFTVWKNMNDILLSKNSRLQEWLVLCDRISVRKTLAFIYVTRVEKLHPNFIGMQAEHGH